jgi:two-component system, NarL family, nitrate/nitrite response regulator NarL
MTERDTKSAKPIRVLLAGPHLSQNHAFDQWLVAQSGFLMIAETGGATHAPKHVARHKPDVVVLRAFTPEGALEAIDVMLSRAPKARLLVLTDSFSLDQATLILEHGACGVIAAKDACAHGLRALQAVHDGEIWGSRALLSQIVNNCVKHTTQLHAHENSSLNLTGRESDIIKLLRSGSSNKQIASSLSISDYTVKTHLQNIFSKLQVHRRQQILPALLA